MIFDLPGKEESKRHLLGALEIALFMPEARARFNNDYNEARRSFLIPLLLFPLTLLLIYFSPESAHKSAGNLALLYGLRLLINWAVFLGVVYMIARKINRKDYFLPFVTANNWITMPTTAAFLPVIWMMTTGSHSWEELYPFMVCLLFYGYGCTAYIAAQTLRIPWELAGFIAVLAMTVNESTLNLVDWVGSL